MKLKFSLLERQETWLTKRKLCARLWLQKYRTVCDVVICCRTAMTKIRGYRNTVSSVDTDMQ